MLFPKRNIAIRCAKVSIVFRDLVFQDEMVAERVPGKLTNESMVLMKVPTVVGQDEVGLNRLECLLKEFFHLVSAIRKEPIPETLGLYFVVNVRQKSLRAALSFGNTFVGSVLA